MTHIGTGRYEVTFSANVRCCAYVATTIHAHSQALGVFTAGGHRSENGVYVEIKNQRGGLTDGPAAHAVLTVAPPADDAGTRTADRFHWQWAMAAADGLALYLDALCDGTLPADEDGRIVCEHHEDWAVIRGGDAELASAKHREPEYGVFTTVGQLAGEGGLAHLFGRWHAVDERPACRLVATAGLAPGPARDLESAAVHLRGLRLAGQDRLPIDGKHEPAVRGFTQALREHPKFLPDWWATTTGDDSATREQHAQVGRFLAMLRIEHGQPSRAYIGHAAPSMYCAPVLEHLGCGAASAVAVWEAVLALFRARMRAAGRTPRGGCASVCR